MNTRLYYQLTVRDRTGKVIRRTRRRRCRSFVRGWNELIYVQVDQATNYSMVDIYGDTWAVDYASNTLTMDVAQGFYGGPMVGTGITAVAVTDTDLATRILHGTGSGQLEYYTVTVGTPSVSGSSISFEVERVFHNGSGASITVKEIGLSAHGVDGATVKEFLVARDVLASTVNVPDGGSITVTYTIGVTV